MLPNNYQLKTESSLSPHAYCKAILPRVSRTFAISVGVLRGDFYRSILCSYLLCRIVDTIEDSSYANFSHQQALFKSFTEMFSKPEFSNGIIQGWIDYYFDRVILRRDDEDYYDLIKNTELVIEYFVSLPPNHRKQIRMCVIEMSTGMLEMVSRRENGQSPFFLTTLEDLEQYCYFVAGTVGILTTRLLREHSSQITGTLFKYLEERSVSFGLGLQMTNILKDCWADYQRGLCYVPTEMILKHGLSPKNFFDSKKTQSVKRTIDDIIERAATHLDDGFDLILALPNSQYRVKLSCLWPLFFALKTLIRLKKSDRLLLDDSTKISRAEVKQLMRKTTLLGWSNKSIEKYYARFRAQI